MNVPSRGIHSCRTTSPESCRSILSESVNENRERLKKYHTFQYGLKTSVVLFSMVSKNCLLFQLMKQKSVYSNQEKTFYVMFQIIEYYLFVVDNIIEHKPFLFGDTNLCNKLRTTKANISFSSILFHKIRKKALPLQVF